MTKKLLPLLFACLLPWLSQGQNCLPVTYTYDAAGNRIQRKLLIEPCMLYVIPDSNLAGMGQKLSGDIPPTDEEQEGNTLAGEEQEDATAVVSADINVYPNPVQDRINIELSSIEANPSQGNTQVFLYDAVGKQVYAASTSLQKTEIAVAGLSPGTYFLKIINNGSSTAFKICKY